MPTVVGTLDKSSLEGKKQIMEYLIPASSSGSAERKAKANMRTRADSGIEVLNSEVEEEKDNQDDIYRVRVSADR